MSYEPKPAISLTELHEAIKAGLQAKFPTFNVDLYPRPGDTVETPAIFFELDSIDPDSEDIGTGQQPVTLRFNAYCIRKFGERGKNKLAVRRMAANLIAFLKNQRWSNQKVKGARFVGASRDLFEDNTEEYEVMRVEFEHDAILGEDAWIDEGESPEIVESSGNGEPYEQIEPPA